MMVRDVQQKLMISQIEKNLLLALANRRGISQSDIVRLLIRDEAKKLGLWPPTEKTSDKQPAQAA